MTTISYELDFFKNYNVNPSLLASLIKNGVKDIYHITSISFSIEEEGLRKLLVNAIKTEEFTQLSPKEYEFEFVLPLIAPEHSEIAREIIEGIREEKEQSEIEKRFFQENFRNLCSFFPR